MEYICDDSRGGRRGCDLLSKASARADDRFVQSHPFQHQSASTSVCRVTPTIQDNEHANAMSAGLWQESLAFMIDAHGSPEERGKGTPVWLSTAGAAAWGGTQIEQRSFKVCVEKLEAFCKT